MFRNAWMMMIATVLVLGVNPVAADSDEDGGTYLALGDSVAAGTQLPDFFTDDGYTDELFEWLEKKHDFDAFVKLACPADDTVEMRFGTGPVGDSLCYPPGGPSQLDLAVGYLTANPGEVRLITIAIGANDLLACDTTAPPPEVQACVGGQLQQIGDNLPVIIGTLQEVAPGVPIVAMNYYNPNLAFWVAGPEGQEFAALSQQLTIPFNDTLQDVYDAFGVPVVDVADAFDTYSDNGKTPKNVRQVCKLTLMCEKVEGDYVLSDYDPGTPGPQTDIHPSDKGYDKIAQAHRKLINKLDLIDD